MFNFKRTIDEWKKRQLIDKKLVDTPENAAMRNFLLANSPSPETPLDECQFLAVDIETTGLSNNKDTMLSIGYVPINRHCIDLSQARHYYLKSDAVVGESATIHGITDKHLAENGLAIETVMQEFLQALTGRVLLVHYATLDYGFLNSTSKDLYGVPLLCPFVDTMEIEKRRQLRINPNQTLKLRLDNCRKNYNLPRYSAHNALTDALATAELWIAQMLELQDKKKLLLKDCS